MRVLQTQTRVRNFRMLVSHAFFGTHISGLHCMQHENRISESGRYNKKLGQVEHLTLYLTKTVLLHDFARLSGRALL